MGWRRQGWRGETSPAPRTSRILVSCTSQLLPTSLDTAQPQLIMEEEELERMKWLAQRERVIYSLGIVELITHLLNPGQQCQKAECRVRGLGKKGVVIWLWR